MHVLAIGNSFSQDATRYLAAVAAGQGVDLQVTNLFIGGCSLARHTACLRQNEPAYLVEENGVSTGRTIALSQALNARQWDVITLQQVSQESPRYATYQPYLNQLADACRAACPTAALWMHQTWAYEDGSRRLCEELGYASSRAMWQDIRAAYAQAAAAIHATGIIPCGRAMQALTDGGLPAHRDTFHAGLGAGRYTLALVWYGALTGRPLPAVCTVPLDEPVPPEHLDLCRAAAQTALTEAE